MCRNKALLLLTLICIIIGLLTTLTPFSDIDHDGSLDSLVTEGFLLLPMVSAVIGLFSLLIRLPTACLTTPQSFFTLLVPPPIPTK